jgi:hypothetical protein
MASSSDHAPLLPGSLRARLEAWLRGLLGWALLLLCLAASVCLLTWSAADPSFTRTTSGAVRNSLGPAGANIADVAMRLLGLAAVFIILPPGFWALQLITRRRLEEARMKAMLAPVAVLLLACAASALPSPATWPLPYGLGGLLGDQTLRFLGSLLASAGPERATAVAGLLCLVAGPALLMMSLGMSLRDLRLLCGRPRVDFLARAWRRLVSGGDRGGPQPFVRHEPTLDMFGSAFPAERRPPFPAEPAFDYEPPIARAGEPRPAPSGKRIHLRRPVREREPEFDKTTDVGSQDMARRFAPSRDESPGAPPFGFLRRRGGAPTDDGGERTARKPVWPGSVPATAEGEMAPADAPFLHRRGAEDELYGRAVALVRAHRKASTAYLQQSLGIRYLRAAKLIDRMEREGIVGAPVHNGVRPILGVLARTRVV